MSPEAADWWKRANRALETAKRDLAVDPDAAASRAYYAAFYAASALFALEQRSFRKHAAVETAVHGELVKSGRWTEELGSAYSELMSQRLKADYGGELHVTHTEAEEAVSKARQIVEAVRVVIEKAPR